MATLFTRLLQPNGTGAYPATLVIRAARVPNVRGGGLVNGTPITLNTDATGFVSTPIVAGRYLVWIGGAEVGSGRSFEVPAGDSTYLLEDLLGAGAGYAPLNYRFASVVLQLVNGTTGGWHTIRIAGASVPQLTIGLQDADLTSDNYQWQDTSLYLRNADAAAWQQVYITGTTPQIAIATAANPVARNARINAGRLQFLNVTTGLYHTVYVSGTTSLTIAIGPGEA